jgi:hypothetical protein
MESLAEHRGQISQSSDASVDAFVVVAVAVAVAVAEQIANVVTALAVATAKAVVLQDPKTPSSSSNQDTGVSNLGVLIV